MEHKSFPNKNEEEANQIMLKLDNFSKNEFMLDTEDPNEVINILNKVSDYNKEILNKIFDRLVLEKGYNPEVLRR